MKDLIKIFLKIVPRHYLHKIAHFFLILTSPFYRGNNFEDPITGIKYRKMLPFGRNRARPNALAPDSMSLERHRLMWLYLREKTNFFTAPQLKMLHIAPEYCFIDRFKKMKNLEYITADLNSPWADIKMDAHDIPFENNTFDVIIANHLLEHVEDDKKVLSEFYRVMKSGGWGIFLVPMDKNRATTYEDPSITDPRERAKHFWQSDHLRLYGRDYGDRLASAGFEVTEDHFVKTLDDATTQRYSLPKDDVIYFCKKL